MVNKWQWKYLNGWVKFVSMILVARKEGDMSHVQLLKPSFQLVLNLLQIVHRQRGVSVRHAAKCHIGGGNDLN